jgi:hypothetical protein
MANALRVGDHILERLGAKREEKLTMSVQTVGAT